MKNHGRRHHRSSGSRYSSFRDACSLISLGVIIGTLLNSLHTSRLVIDHSIIRIQQETFPPSIARHHMQDSYKYKTNVTTGDELLHLRGPNGPKYNVLVTGAAGFIGMHTAIELKRIGMTPIGYDNVNTYYSTDLKESRIQELKKEGILFERGDVCDVDKLKQVIEDNDITRFIHLAAQAGVRYSLDHPFEYVHNNIDCTVNLLEILKELNLKEHPLIYASSSSVYGNNVKVPFQERDPVEDPASLYAATKRSDELVARTYCNLYNISSIGLRFFTVYGPYGRPDMAPWMFTDKISNNETIQVFNHGLSRRDFTYIDDIVQGVVNSLLVDRVRTSLEAEVINLGNGQPVLLADFVRIVENRVGKPAQIEYLGMQKGDVPTTYADISKAKHLLGYKPSTSIEEGIDKFVTWFEQHRASRYRMTQPQKLSPPKDEKQPQ
uniref:NAD(P)-binding domain-containing protein n=1 Tax=Pseudo-nitzschia australis TaxID=44445 RepID=A0A7S4EM06_9STRA|mmetsp:Transcript_20789/g.42282  ORF Transcript_20789/g.42282 Transcript_20789/m.42282 type:complete len:437 (+) Transcript_20789:100-1410(+)|eukprot:CAMPEP_0168246750 /NCGR_PEP_ID=MMETSP0141_2-20121125/514_1 /TAXON_ID=44445 /ORGANISM="Pseudo-nitzschia australis, Strain 10249 10 AB" /LENGTH=436 /DNA_ID=CAMNT_0008182457 /DNA_START=65 /DNA_END=1375 /DNA_ORIENTATION=+